MHSVQPIVRAIRFGLTFLAAVVALIAVSAGAAPTANAAIYLVDPFLAAKLDNRNNLANLDLSTLYRVRNWAAVQAKGLNADNTSAAIAIVETSNAAADVTLTGTNGTALLPYDPQFLTKAPASGGTASLTIPAANFIQVGSVFFAAALVQAPAVGATYDVLKPITISAAQNATLKQATMDLDIPPVVLVHGLWGDATSLQALRQYLLTTPQWQKTGLVDAICYSPYLAFDAKTDPLTNGGDSCEYTSATALGLEINHLMTVLDTRHVVGGRVDVVAHSMGGLAVRHFSALAQYRSARNRAQGAFHVLATLDTPETGSSLAAFLDNHSQAKLAAPIFSGAWNLWESQCDESDDIRVCFDKLGLPLAAGSLPLNTGAVSSLIPSGLSLKGAPDPRIPGVIWRAVTATWPVNDRPSSLLRSVLNDLIKAIYSNTGSAPSVDTILGTPDNDVVVTTQSQTGDAQVFYNFADLAHTKTPDPSIFSLFFDGVNQNVEESASVDRLVGCWLANLGATNCKQVLQAAPENATPMVAGSAPHLTKFAAADRLALGQPTQAPRFGETFELPLRFASAVSRTVIVAQADRHGEITSGSGTTAIIRQAGDTSFVRVTPQRIGPMTFTAAAAFSDGGVAVKHFTANVLPPVAKPTAFTGGHGPVVITLDADEPTAMLQPEATYAGMGTLRLAPKAVTATVAQSTGTPVIRLRDGVIHALRPGEATIDARYGGLSDRVQVIVKARTE